MLMLMLMLMCTRDFVCMRVAGRRLWRVLRDASLTHADVVDTLAANGKVDDLSLGLVFTLDED